MLLASNFSSLQMFQQLARISEFLLLLTTSDHSTIGHVELIRQGQFLEMQDPQDTPRIPHDFNSICFHLEIH